MQIILSHFEKSLKTKGGNETEEEQVIQLWAMWQWGVDRWEVCLALITSLFDDISI